MSSEELESQPLVQHLTELRNRLIRSIIAVLVVFIALYVYRAKAQEDDLQHNHMTFLIRTTWIAGLFALIGMPIFYFLGDHFVIKEMFSNIASGHSFPTEEDLHILSRQYALDNIAAFMIAFAPSVLYFLYRLTKGALRAVKGYRVLNPKGWF